MSFYYKKFHLSSWLIEKNRLSLYHTAAAVNDVFKHRGPQSMPVTNNRWPICQFFVPPVNLTTGRLPSECKADATATRSVPPHCQPERLSLAASRFSSLYSHTNDWRPFSKYAIQAKNRDIPLGHTQSINQFHSLIHYRVKVWLI